MSAVAERGDRPELPDHWGRLERAAEDAALAVAVWRRRALEAEAEALRLRRVLEGVAADRTGPQDVDEEVRRLRAENAALQSRMREARKRVAALMRRLLSLGVDA